MEYWHGVFTDRQTDGHIYVQHAVTLSLSVRCVVFIGWLWMCTAVFGGWSTYRRHDICSVGVSFLFSWSCGGCTYGNDK